MHFDDNNNGVTFLSSIELSKQGSLVGGSHVLCGVGSLLSVKPKPGRAVVVRDSTKGVTYVGDYRRVLHANAASRRGRRFIMTAYSSSSLRDMVNKQSNGTTGTR